MKRAFGCIFVTLMLISIFAFAIAENEITFLDIPWMSNEEATLRTLSEKGFIRYAMESNYRLTNDACPYLKTDSEGNVDVHTDKHNQYCFSTFLNDVVKGRIAGYPVSNITLTFAYDGEFQLIYAKVDLIEANYSDIRQKLINAYGDSEAIETDEGHNYLWKGKNNSCVALLEYYDGQAFDLCYGRLDANDILEKCKDIDLIDIAGL